MTTKNSPLRVLKAQAREMAITLKAAERSDPVDTRLAEKIAASRESGVFKVGIVMDDKVITISIPWAVVSRCTTNALAEYILDLMRETRQVVN